MLSGVVDSHCVEIFLHDDVVQSCCYLRRFGIAIVFDSLFHEHDVSSLVGYCRIITVILATVNSFCSSLQYVEREKYNA